MKPKSMRAAGFVSLTLLATYACSSSDAMLGSADSGSQGDSGSTGVSGRWCGKEVSAAEQCTGDEVIYLEVAQSGSAVTGQACEAYNNGCYPLENGSFDKDQLSFRYTFTPDHVDASLTLSGDTLSGTLSSTKADAPLPLTLHRIR